MTNELPPPNLERLRSELTTIDRRIVELIAARQKTVGEIGRVKRDARAATRDYAREKEVLELGRERAANLGVDPDLAESVLRRLILSSLQSQERDRVVAEGRGDGRQALIIGGAGRMGVWLADFLASQGFGVVVADPSVEPGPGRYRDWTDAGLDQDVIAVAAPLAISGEILGRLADRRPKGLVFDIGSLKTPLEKGLRALAAAGCQVTSIHPMFGPDTRLLSGRHLIVCDVGCAEATEAAKRLFGATMVEPIEMSLEEHDRVIAYVLGLSHALNIAFFTALAESGEDAPRLATLSSTTFDSQLLVSQAVARDNPRLYFEIQHLNRFGREPLDALAEAARRIRDLVAEGDEEKFVELMRTGRDYLASRR